jgi:hypothetical protein
VSKIEGNAFKECYFLQLVVLPKSVQISEPVFEGCREFEDWDRNLNADEDNDYMHFLMTRFDKLPIHRACYYLNSIDGDNSGSMPPEVFTQQLKELIETKSESVVLKDDMGMTPLHVLCCNPRATPEMIRLLMSAHPDAAMVRNVSKMSPLDMYLVSKHVISSYNYEDIRDGRHDDDDNGIDGQFDVKKFLAASRKTQSWCKNLDLSKAGLSCDVTEVITVLCAG